MSALKEKKIDGGVIKYKEPTLITLLKMLPSGMIDSNGESSLTDNPQLLIADMLEKLPLIIVEIKHPTCKTFEDLIKSAKFMTPLIEICTECVQLISDTGDEEVKKP